MCILEKVIVKEQTTSRLEMFIRMRTNLLFNNTIPDDPELVFVRKKIDSLITKKNEESPTEDDKPQA